MSGELCAYQLTFPWGAGEYDRLIMEPVLLQNVDVYLTEAKTYFSRKVNE